MSLFELESRVWVIFKDNAQIYFDYTITPSEVPNGTIIDIYNEIKRRFNVEDVQDVSVKNKQGDLVRSSYTKSLREYMRLGKTSQPGGGLHYKRTKEYIKIGKVKRCIYIGARGGRYVKWNGTMKSVKQLLLRSS